MLRHPNPPFPGRRARRHGFTLLEMILVMALLSIVLAVAAPALSRFFRGRSLDSEARQFLALTRYAQSRAVSEGAPMVLWIDAEQGAYGLQAEPSYIENDSKAVEFTLGDRLGVEVILPAGGAQLNLWSETAMAVGNVPMIRFTPDGFISENSPHSVVFREGEDSEIWVSQSRNRLNYEIQANNTSSPR